MKILAEAAEKMVIADQSADHANTHEARKSTQAISSLQGQSPHGKGIIFQDQKLIAQRESRSRIKTAYVFTVVVDLNFLLAILTTAHHLRAQALMKSATFRHFAGGAMQKNIPKPTKST